MFELTSVIINHLFVEALVKRFVPPQDVNVLDQGKIDKLMLDMDGTDNKCEMLSVLAVRSLSLFVVGVLRPLSPQLNLVLTPSWACPWLCARLVQQRRASPSTATLPIWLATPKSSSLFP